ncbi:methanethiol S-methyltransferase [Nocardia aurantia]|uniref:methanethiol S-methyltransferase n=1 Tax=Nocardia aurantia TaxID=2585199 RepID=UPI001296791A|nr:methanethiol S-methyltransferase [Nocardia aurantia]
MVPPRSGPGAVRRISPRPGAIPTVIYGTAVYVLFLVVFLYAIGWVEGLVVPRTIDEGPAASTRAAVAIDVLLLTVFALQHSVMARPVFKRRWTRIVPAPAERSTYVLCASAALALVMWQWRPIPEVIWDVSAGPARITVYAVSFAGWALALTATFAIDHAALFGLRQVFGYRAGTWPAATEFRTPALYRTVRHPLYLGFLIAFWAAPTMTGGRLLFAALTTAYILAAVPFEEHDLVAEFGNRYRVYRHRVPALVPFPHLPQTSHPLRRGH